MRGAPNESPGTRARSIPPRSLKTASSWRSSKQSCVTTAACQRSKCRYQEPEQNREGGIEDDARDVGDAARDEVRDGIQNVFNGLFN